MLALSSLWHTVSKLGRYCILSDSGETTRNDDSISTCRIDADADTDAEVVPTGTCYAADEYGWCECFTAASNEIAPALST